MVFSIRNWHSLAPFIFRTQPQPPDRTCQVVEKSLIYDTPHAKGNVTTEPLEIIRGTLLQEFVGAELNSRVGGHPYYVDERTAIKSLHAVSGVCLPHTVPVESKNRQDVLEGGGRAGAWNGV